MPPGTPLRSVCLQREVRFPRPFRDRYVVTTCVAKTLQEHVASEAMKQQVGHRDARPTGDHVCERRCIASLGLIAAFLSGVKLGFEQTGVPRIVFHLRYGDVPLNALAVFGHA